MGLVTSELALHCVYTNCLSISNKLSEIKQLSLDSQIHIFAFTETWLEHDVNDAEVAIPGFSIFRGDSSRGRAGGVAVYISNSLPGPILCTGFKTSHKCDAIWLQLSLRGTDVLLLGVIYKSPSISAPEDAQLIDSLGEFVRSQRHTHLLILGDFNAPKVDWTFKCSPDVRFSLDLVSLIQKEAWTQHVKDATRYRDGQVPSLLDLVITNESHYVDRILLDAPLGKSDHLLIRFDLICYWTSVDRTGRLVRNFNKADLVGLRNYFLSLSFPSNSVEDLSLSFMLAIQKADLSFIPRRSFNSKVKPLPRRIRRLLHRRSAYFAKYKYTAATEDALAFRRVRNECKSAIREHTQKIQSKVLSTARYNKNALFKYMRQRRKNNPSAFTLRQADGIPSSEPAVVAELFRSYFASVYLGELSTEHPVLEQRPFREPLLSINFTVDEVREQLCIVNAHSSMGPDDIHPRILKEAASVLAAPLGKLFHLTLTTGVLPSYWKSATVVPIYKGGDRLSPNSYRPISLTSIPCKVLERILKKRILAHLLDNSLISPAQHGFLPQRSCITNLLLFMDSLTEARDNGLISDAIFFDFAKAFDSVPHAPLIHLSLIHI
jgi:hypothetical protein